MYDNALHLQKAQASIRDSLEPDSNVTSLKALHDPKQPLQRTSTLDGMHMDDNELPLKALTSIRDRLEPGSNVTVDRLKHPLKQPSQRISTPVGMHIDDNELHHMKAIASIRDT
jgi:hypothetical protein